MIWFYIYYGSNIKVVSKMFASNRHYTLTERKNTRYTQILFQEFKIANFTRLSFISLPLLKILEDVFAPVHDLGTLGSLVRFFFILSGYKMHHNNLKYGKIVDDFCYIPKSFCSMNVDGGGVILGLLFRISENRPRCNITWNGFCDP